MSATKRTYEEDDHDGMEGSAGRMGRVRKKSAKLREMEEVEVIEKTTPKVNAKTSKKVKKDPASVSLETLQKRLEGATSPLPPNNTALLSPPPSSAAQKKVRKKKNSLSDTEDAQFHMGTSLIESSPLDIKDEPDDEADLSIHSDVSALDNAAELKMALMEAPQPLLQSDTEEGPESIDVGAEADVTMESDADAENSLLDDVEEDEASEISDGVNGGDDESSGSDSEEDAPLVIDTPPPPPPPPTKKSPKKTSPSKLPSAHKSGFDVDVGTNQPPVYSNTQDMISRFQTSAERKKERKKKTKKLKGVKGSKIIEDPKKKKRPLTAYMLWGNTVRPTVISQNPGIDFATISRRLGEIWQSLPEKEKMAWKGKAKRLANKSGAGGMVSSGKYAKVYSRKGTKGRPGSSTPNTAASPPVTNPITSPHIPESPEQYMYKVVGTSPVDAAAHLKLLGESLSIIGARLQEHQGQIAVQGSLSVLLDSLLCALGPLTCLTAQLPELDGCHPDTHSKTLDNIAYFMPGIG